MLNVRLMIGFHLLLRGSMLERELSPQQPCFHVMSIIKKALHIAMTAPVCTALQYITTQGLHPTVTTSKALHNVRQTTQKKYARTFTLRAFLSRKGLQIQELRGQAGRHLADIEF